MKVLEIRTSTHRELVDITAKIAAAIEELGVANGLCHVFVPHTTAGITINENADPDVTSDLIRAYGEIIPKIRFAHAEGNSDAHLMTSLLGSSVTIPVESGRLSLGTWQGIYFAEFDGPRSRRCKISMIPG